MRGVRPSLDEPAAKAREREDGPPFAAWAIPIGRLMSIGAGNELRRRPVRTASGKAKATATGHMPGDLHLPAVCELGPVRLQQGGRLEDESPHAPGLSPATDVPEDGRR